MKKSIVLLSTLLILFFGVALSWGQQTISEEARRHFDRGMAAVEMAKSPDDYAPAIKEFEQAIRLAPEWPDAYYKLGIAQEKAGRLKDAVDNLKRYLRLAPNATDADTVKSLINKLEFKAEQEITKEDALEIFGSLSDTTKWRFVGESSAYKNWVKGLRRDGDQILITYINDIRKWTTSTAATEPQGKTLTLTYQFAFFNFCGQSCDVFGQYIFKIVSKNKVQVEAMEVWPKIAPIEQKPERATFEYIRIF